MTGQRRVQCSSEALNPDESSRTPFERGRMEHSQHECAADKSAERLWCNHVNMEHRQRNVFNILRNPCHEELSFEGKGRPSISMVFLTKCSVSYMTTHYRILGVLAILGVMPIIELLHLLPVNQTEWFIWLYEVQSVVQSVLLLFTATQYFSNSLWSQGSTVYDQLIWFYKWDSLKWHHFNPSF